jgi:hypothetical protein
MALSSCSSSRAGTHTVVNRLDRAGDNSLGAQGGGRHGLRKAGVEGEHWQDQHMPNKHLTAYTSAVC